MIDGWRSQLRKGAAELAVLSVLEDTEKYGIEVLSAFEAFSGLGVAEGTIYPLLSRLEKAGRLESRWVTDGQAPHPRRYYALTPDGRAALAEMRTEWRVFRDALDGLTGTDVKRAA